MRLQKPTRLHAFAGSPVARPLRSRVGRLPTVVALVAALACAVPVSAATSAKDMYTQALARERTLRDASRQATVKDFRDLMNRYYRIVLRYPRSGYSDNALWQAGGLALVAYERFHDEADRRAGERYLKMLRSEYPSSSLAPRVAAQITSFDTVARAHAAALAEAERQRQAAEAAARAAAAASTAAAAPADGLARIRQIVRQPLPAGTRVIIELDDEVTYQEERLEDPPRVFFDLKGVAFDPALDPGAQTVPGDVIRDIRLGKHPDDTARVVLELTEEPKYSVFALFDPYRLVIDFARTAPAPPQPRPDAAPAVVRTPVEAPPPLDATPPAANALPAPAAPNANSNGQFSLARQLGLGISRIVIDPGHGGHDPGAKGAGLTEAAAVLDIALRLEKLLREQPGIEVIMTRRTDVFIPLEERTAIANRANADLFLSIHANAGRSRVANGIETYFLNFASNPEAEQVAARENSASGGTMHNLPDIVQAIALNNKLDESKDLARMVQDALIARVKPQHKAVRNRGVKQGPFVVLIGAQMPSVLAEVSFITNRTEITLLQKPTYRQRLAQGLFDAINKYQKSLKNVIVTANGQ